MSVSRLMRCTSCTLIRSYACIVDVSRPANEDKAEVGKNMGIFLGVALLGLLVGPVVGGLVAEYWSNRGAFVAAGFAAWVSAPFTRWFVPETLSHPKLFRWEAAMPHRVLSVLVATPLVRNTALVLFGMNWAFGPYQIGALYTEMRFGWDAVDIGAFLG